MNPTMWKVLALVVTASLSVLNVWLAGNNPEDATRYAALAAVWGASAGIWIGNLIITWGER